MLALNDAQFKSKLKSQVADPFSSGIRSYNSALTDLSKLLTTQTAQDGLPVEIPPALASHVNIFVSKIKFSSKNAHALAKETSKSITDHESRISQAQKSIANTNNLINQNQIRVNSLTKEVQAAQAALGAAQRNLNTHRDALRHAERRYQKAKNKCLGRRRRKRGLFKKIKKAIKKTVRLPEKLVKEAYRGICRGLNVFTKNIDKAKRSLRQAEAQVRQATAQLNAKRGQLAKTQNELAALRRKKAALEQQKRQNQANLTGLKQKRPQIIGLDKKMKDTVRFLDGIRARGTSAQLVAQFGFLLDPKGLTGPLMEIGNKMKTLSGGTGVGFLPKFSPAEIKALSKKLKGIKIG
jgi:DNA repair exonuclease SbcCD ATPase subunit